MRLGKYIYRGKDMTLFIFMKIRGVTNILAEKLDIPFEEALRRLYKTEAYKKGITNTETNYLYENSAFIADEVLREWGMI